ncbi:MAG: hypothetical protein QOD12_2060 [Verrucomicrobiota bacterium]
MPSPCNQLAFVNCRLEGLTNNCEPSSYIGLETLEALEGARNYHRHLTRLIMASVGRARRLLDFGAGLGTFAKLLRDRGYAVTCVESHRHLIKRLKNEGFETYSSLASIPPGSVEFAYSLNVLEHMEDDESAVAELVTKLSGGGKLFLYLPAFQCLWTSLDDKIGHHRRYTKARLRRLASSQGLELLSIAYADSLGFPAALFFKFLGNKKGRLTPSGVRFYDRILLPLSAKLDRVLHPFLGKNVWALCRKPDHVPLPTRP